MPNNDEQKPRKTWLMIKRAPQVLKNNFMTKDDKKFMTSDNQEFLVKEVE